MGFCYEGIISDLKPKTLNVLSGPQDNAHP